jgi:glycosyltransferase 2 family protein
MTNKLPSKRGANIKRFLFWGIKFFVSAALIGYLLAKIGLGNALEQASSIPLKYLIGAFCLVLLQAILGAIRWRFVVVALGARLATSKAIIITSISLFFNQFLPASVGADIVRVWQSNRAGLALSTGVTSVILERIGNLLSVIVIALATLPVLATYLHSEGTQYVFALSGITGIATISLLIFLDRLPESWGRWRVVRGLAKLARDTRLLFLSPLYASLLFMTAIAGQVALAAAALLLALGLGLDVQLIDCIVVMPAVVLISSLPISVGGWGVRELAMVTAFSMLSVPSDSALALSLVLALTATAVSLPGGVIWLWLRSEPSTSNPR